MLIRLLEHRLGHVFPVNRIIDSLKKYTCVRLGTNTWQFTYYDEILAACGTALDLELDKKYRTQQDIQRLLRY